MSCMASKALQWQPRSGNFRSQTSTRNQLSMLHWSRCRYWHFWGNSMFTFWALFLQVYCVKPGIDPVMILMHGPGLSMYHCCRFLIRQEGCMRRQLSKYMIMLINSRNTDWVMLHVIEPTNSQCMAVSSLKIGCDKSKGYHFVLKKTEAPNLGIMALLGANS